MADKAQAQQESEPGQNSQSVGRGLWHRANRHGGPSRELRDGEGFRIISKDGMAEHWATNDLEVDELGRLKLAEASWKIEEYHRGLKQVTNVEGCQCRKAPAQRSHIGLALRAFLVFERYCFRTGYNWVATKAKIFQEAVRAFRANPWIGRHKATA